MRTVYFVVKSGLGRVTVSMTREDCEIYIQGAEANGGKGYSICSEWV